MQAGKLRHHIQIQRKSDAPNSYGEPVAIWSTIGEAWANIETISGRELMQADRLTAEASHRITMRYYSGLTTDDRIVLGDRLFDINHIDNKDQRNAEMILLCKEAV